MNRTITSNNQHLKAAKRHNAAVEARREDWKRLLSTEWGRRWFIQTLRQADPYRTGRMDLFDAGRTDVARCLLAEARIADLAATLQMEQEERDEALHTAEADKPGQEDEE